MNIFSSATPNKPNKKATEATENIRKYRKARETVVNNYIKTIISELDKNITETSRIHGGRSLDFNYAKIKIDAGAGSGGSGGNSNADQSIVFGDLTDAEHELIREKISEYLTNEGFTLGVSSSTYPKLYRTLIKVSWNAP